MSIIRDDCLNVMKQMDDNSIDLIYLDPPFFTQKKHSLTDSKSGKIFYFDDKWSSLEDYLSYLEIRIVEMKRILRSTGSIFLHCDNTASHYLKCLLDKVFGIDNFRSEIIWFYKRWSNSKKGLLNSHQNIFYYSKTKNFKFNKIFQDYSLTTNIDQILQERVRDSNGKTIYKKNLEGDTLFSKEKKGVPMSDVWEIPFLNPKAKERVSYPTQKPIELLERIIKISTDYNDTVLDPFCGSGTTLVASDLLDRKYIGIDINSDAIELTRNRLNLKIKTKSKLLQKGKEYYDEKSEFEKSILNSIECNIVQRNRGIDAFLVKMYENTPVAIRIQKNDESLLDAVGLLKKAMESKKCKISFLIKTSKLSELFEDAIPSNIILLDSHSIQINEIIKSFNSHKKVATKLQPSDRRFL